MLFHFFVVIFSPYASFWVVSIPVCSVSLIFSSTVSEVLLILFSVIFQILYFLSLDASFC